MVQGIIDVSISKLNKIMSQKDNSGNSGRRDESTDSHTERQITINEGTGPRNPKRGK